MHNYIDLEADYPRSKAVRKFLLADYFHDSSLKTVDYNKDGKELTIRLQCCGDYEEATGQGAFDDEVYGYVLQFRGVMGFRYNTDSNWEDYLNGRFKKTAWLLETQKRTKRALYQFRMQLADGYLDIIFHSFQIRKVKGRINYRGINSSEEFFTECYAESPEELNRLREELNMEDDPMMDDYRLEQLYLNGEEDLPSLCRMVLKKNQDEDVKAYAAWLLGKCGDLSDRALIWQAYQEWREQSGNDTCSWNWMMDRNYQDAIEYLTWKNQVLGSN